MRRLEHVSGVSVEVTLLFGGRLIRPAGCIAFQKVRIQRNMQPPADVIIVGAGPGGLAAAHAIAAAAPHLQVPVASAAAVAAGGAWRSSLHAWAPAHL